MKRLLTAIVLCAYAAAYAAAPATVKATYDVFRDGLRVAVTHETFENNGSRYHIVSESNPVGLLAMFFRTRVKVLSSGTVTPAGLRPEQFEYGRLDDASKNVSAAFDWQAGQLRLTFDGRSETIVLPRDTQDRVSLMYQFMFLAPENLGRLAFHMTNGRKVEPYRYRLAGSVELDTHVGKLNTLHLVKEREAGDNAVEVWLAPDRHLIPVKVLIVENDGSKYEQAITQLEVK